MNRGCRRFYREDEREFASANGLFNAANYEGYDESLSPEEQSEDTYYQLTLSAFEQGKVCP